MIIIYYASLKSLDLKDYLKHYLFKIFSALQQIHARTNVLTSFNHTFNKPD